MMRLFYLVPLAVFAAVAAYFYVGLQRDPHQLPSALVDKPVPQFDLPPLQGRKAGDEAGLSTATLKDGQVKLVNVFASWCGPCRLEHPLIERVANELKIPVYAINYKDTPQAALEWLTRFGDPYRRLGADRDGRVAIDWGVYGVPETFVVDGQGIIRYRYPGPITPQELEGRILPLIRSLKG